MDEIADVDACFYKAGCNQSEAGLHASFLHSLQPRQWRFEGGHPAADLPFLKLSFGEWNWWELGFLGTLGHRCYTVNTRIRICIYIKI